MSWVKVSGMTEVDRILSPFKYQFYVKPEQEIMDTINDLIRKENPYLSQLEIHFNSIKFISCMGCLEDQPNQLAHMDPGGCLYLRSDDMESVGMESDVPLSVADYL